MVEYATVHVLENEKEIVERAKKDDVAFEILYNHYFPKIYGFIFKRIGNREITEDLVSITFMKVFCNIKGYKYQNCSFGAWVYRIAINNLTDFYRKHSRKKEISLCQAGNIMDNCEFIKKAENVHDRELILNTLAKLSKKHQKILHLKFFAELNNKEIAEVFGISINNAGVLLHRALKCFEKKYNNIIIQQS